MMTGNRIDRMAAKVAFFILADRQPDDPIFDATFSVLRQKARDFKDQLEEKAKNSLKDSLINDLKGKGYEVISVDISLGKYRGSRFVTSAKVRIKAKDAREAKAVVKDLQRYHPRYSLKTFDEATKQAEYNIR
jgi:hypothetical protein